MPRIFKVSVRVKYADTDKMQVVYHARYLEYFEAARNELLRDMDYPYTLLESQKQMLPIIEVRLIYQRPAFYDDIIVIHSTISHYDKVQLTISYDVFRTADNGELEKISEGFTKHVFMNELTRKPTRPPQELVEKILASMS